MDSWIRNIWIDKPIPDLDGMSRKAYVLTGTDPADPWMRMRIALRV